MQAVVVRSLLDMTPGSPQTITGIMAVGSSSIGDLRSWGASARYAALLVRWTAASIDRSLGERREAEAPGILSHVRPARFDML